MSSKKMITSKKMLQRLQIAAAQVFNISENLLTTFYKVIYSLY